MKLKVTDASVPAGNYTAQFVGAETTNHKEYREGLVWKFKITQGPQAGKTALRFTGPGPSPNVACGRMLSGLAGRPLELGEVLDPDNFVGKSYLIVVAQSPKEGMTRVEAVTPVATA